MAFEVVFDSVETAPEEVRSALKKREDGKFSANVVPNSKLDEFRDTNITIRKQNDELMKFKETLTPIVGESVDEFIRNYSTLTETKKKVDNKELVENSSFESALQKRTEEMNRNYKDQIEKLQTATQSSTSALAEVTQKYHSVLVDRHVTNAVMDPKNGALPEALADIVSHARSVFKVDDKGEIIPTDTEGNKLYGSDGSRLLTPDEWLGKLRQSKPYLFKASSGGGAQGSGSKNFKDADVDNMSMDEYVAWRKKQGFK